jgi:hypothetical protein
LAPDPFGPISLPERFKTLQPVARSGIWSDLRFNHEGETIMTGYTGRDRRAFLGGALATGAACFGTGLKEALAQAKAAGKPLLTVEKLNALIDTNHRKGRDSYSDFLRGSTGNYIAFLQKHFHVTDGQVHELKQLSPGQLEFLDFCVEFASKRGHKLGIGISPPIIPQHPNALNVPGEGHDKSKVIRSSYKREEMRARDVLIAILDGASAVLHAVKP